MPYDNYVSWHLLFPVILSSKFSFPYFNFFFDILMFLQFMLDDDSKYIGVSLIFETHKCFYKPLISWIIKVWASEKNEYRGKSTYSLFNIVKIIGTILPFLYMFYSSPQTVSLPVHAYQRLGQKKQSTHFWWSAALLQPLNRMVTLCIIYCSEVHCTVWREIDERQHVWVVRQRTQFLCDTLYKLFGCIHGDGIWWMCIWMRLKTRRKFL